MIILVGETPTLRIESKNPPADHATQPKPVEILITGDVVKETKHLLESQDGEREYSREVCGDCSNQIVYVGEHGIAECGCYNIKDRLQEIETELISEMEKPKNPYPEKGEITRHKVTGNPYLTQDYNLVLPQPIEEFIKSKGINLDYAKGINLLQDVGSEKCNLLELMEEYAALKAEEALVKAKSMTEHLSQEDRNTYFEMELNAIKSQ